MAWFVRKLNSSPEEYFYVDNDGFIAWTESQSEACKFDDKSGADQVRQLLSESSDSVQDPRVGTPNVCPYCGHEAFVEALRASPPEDDEWYNRCMGCDGWFHHRSDGQVYSLDKPKERPTEWQR